MYHKFLRSLYIVSFLLAATLRLTAQPCADTQPLIAGPQVVSDNQAGVIYSTANIPGHTYTWTVVGGTITGGAGTSQITVLWGPIGMGSVSVTETNPAAGCNATDTKGVSKRPLLISYFYYTNTSCYGDALSFFDASVADPVNPIVSYYWDFGDGTTSTLQNPTHTYLPPYNTTWTVTFIVTNLLGQQDTIYDAVYVNPNQFIPAPAFSFNVPNCDYQAVPFNSSASTTPPGTGNIIHWDWDFGDPASGANNTSTLPNPAHIFSAPGTYTVNLEITNERYCKNNLSQVVTIQASRPTANYSFTNPTCVNNPIFFTDLSSAPAGFTLNTWEWNFADGSAPVVVNAPASPNVSHIFTGVGPYNVKLRVLTNRGCVDSIYRAVSLTPSPKANFQWDTHCATDTVHFQNLSKTNQGPSITGYSWDFGDPASGNNTSTLPNPPHVYSNTGTYTVRLVAVNTTGCPDTLYKSITIYPKPNVEYTWNLGSQNNEIDYHVDSTITNLGAIGYMMVWNFGDGTFGYGHNPVHIYPAGGVTWTCTLTVTDTLGCSNSISHDIYGPETPMAFYSSNSPVCLGTPTCFHDLSSVPTPPFGFIQTWQWDFGDGSPFVTINFPNNPDVCHTYAAPGTYACTLTTWDNSGFSDSYTDNQVVLPNPIANFQYTGACEGQLVQFQDASFPNGGGNIITWDWNFGDPLSGASNTSNQQNPSHIFSSGNATYQVRLIVVNFDNCRDTIIKPVYIFPKPPVEFTHDTACLNQVVTFTANTIITHIDSIASWSWDFGDGSPFSTDPVTTSHLYTSPGVYITTLTVTDFHGCVNSVSHSVRVNPLPIPQFTWNNPVCCNDSVHFIDQSTVPASYTGYVAKWLWDFGDGTTQTVIIPSSPNVTHLYSCVALSHLVRLTVWTSDSCSAFIEKTVVSTPKPVANFDFSTIRCEKSLVQFTDLSQTNGGGAITVYSWNFDDPASGINNTSTIPNPVHTFNIAGTYNVRLIIQNATGCKDTIVKPVIINQLPVSNFSADTACVGNPTQFTDLSIPNAASILLYSWDFGDGSPLSPQQNPSHTYATYGIYNVKLTITNSNGCVKDTTKQVLVNPLPTAAFTFSTPNCFGAVVHYTDLSSTVTGYMGSIVKWTWDFGDGTQTVVTFPGNPNVNHTFVGPALTHTVRLTVQTSDSCSAWVEHVINSIPSPVANFSYPGTNCAGQTVQFTDLSQANGGGSIVTWDWNFGDPASGGNNISSAQNPVHAFTSAGTYTVVLIVTNSSFCTDTMTQSVTISMLPVANFKADTACYGSPTTFTDLSIPNAPNIISWTWNFNDGTPVATAQNPTHIFTNYGVYNVKLTIVNVNGCTKDTTKQVLVNPLPIPEFSFSTPNCLGAPVQYTNLSTTVPGYLGNITTWLWDFGDGTNQTVTFPGNPNVTHTFVGGALTHTVRLTVTTSTGCVNYVEHIVNSMPSPIANFSFPNQSCSGQAVQFTDLSQQNGGGNIISWLWNFGDPGSGGNNTSNAQNPIHYFSAPGTFTVTLVVTNASNCTDTMTNTVTINARPIANFKADTACLGSATTFTDLSTSASGTIAAWLWNFGDGGTATSQNPTHNYGSAGVFTVTLQVTTSLGCIRDTIKNVLVLGKPVPGFTATTPTCASDSVQFTDLSTTPHGTIVKWVWDFGDGSPLVTINFPTSPNVRHKYNAGGTYNVILTITTSDNCQASKTNPVIVTSAPAANFDYGTSRCAQMPVTFTDLSQTNGGPPVTGWLWNFGDPASGTANTSNQQNPTHSFSTDGTFNVKLSATNSSGCTDTITKQVTVNKKPLASFSADTSCFGVPTAFTDNSTPNATSISSWLWNFGDPGSGTNNTSTLQNPTHIFSAMGVYSVTLTVTNSNGCTDDTILSVHVNPQPVAMFSANTACVNSPTQFTDLSTAPGSSIASWLWDFGDGSAPSTQQNPVHIYTAAGTYNVKLVVTNLSNCSDSITLPVLARPTPIAAFVYTNFYCPAGQVSFQDQSQGVGAAISERLWIFQPGYTSSGVNPTYVFPVTDTTYLVTLIVTDNYGCKDTITDSVHVKPGFQFTFKNDTVCFGNPTHFQAINQTKGDTIYSPYWDFGDPNSGPNNISYLYNPVHNFTQPGLYAVKLRVLDSDNCLDSIYKTVQVYALPQPLFTFVSLPCDSIIHFQTQSTAGIGGISSWIWDFGDGTPPLTIPAPGPGDTSHQYPAVGVYKTTLKITNTKGCSDTISHMVELYPCIKASFTHSDTLLCSRYPISFSDSSLPVNIITQWKWQFGDGKDTVYTTHDPIVTHTYDTSGIFIVRLIITANVNGKNFIDTSKQALVIHPTPKPLFSNIPVCMKQVTLFKDTSNTYGEPVKTWRWTFGEPGAGAGDTSLIANPGHKYDTAGYYNVQLLVMNKYGCKDSITKTTRVYGLPTAIFDHEAACNGNPTIFKDMSTAADTVIGKWMWRFGDASASPFDTSTIEDPSYIYKKAGDYTVRLIVKDKFGCLDTVDSAVTVHQSPISAFTLTDNINNMTGKIQLFNQTTGADSYYWDFGNGQHSTEKNPIATYTEDGSYIIMLISSNQFDCIDTTFYKYDVLFKGLYIPNAFAPNTTNYAVRLFKPVGINLKEYHIQVFDIWGHMLWESRLLDAQGRPVEGWDGYYNGVLMPQGTYMWKASGTFIDDSEWQGSDIGKGDAKTSGTVSLIR